ncbi:exopolysaccharide biosynthesis polyprenyl glycosylphosphotransferase [candidate division KSB1 bacterium]|nr:exopolysaccharide biosynthesis polyprenyl glycosylphosphotransferase [candidate division KSB1 bacterium]
MIMLELKKRFNTLFNIAQVLIDLILVSASFYASFWVWQWSPLRIQPQVEFPGVVLCLLIGLVYLFFFVAFGAYQKQATVVNIKVVESVLLATILASGFVIILFFYTKSFQIGRSQMIYFVMILLILLHLERAIMDKIHQTMIKRGIGAVRVLILGAGTVGKRLAKALETYPKLGYLPIGFIDDDQALIDAKIANPLPVLGTTESLQANIEKYSIDQVLIAIPSASRERVQDLMTECQGIRIPFKFVPNLHDVAIPQVRSEEIDGIPMFSFVHLDYKPINRVVKRVVDWWISLFIVILCLPVIALAAVAIKIDSRGPVFFRQFRVGKGGKRFTMWKFRTMYTHAPAYALHPQDKNDPRITRVGRFLRRTSLDELPQFFNVLRGDMSIVGPRPEMEFIVQGYNPLERERLNVWPGITGLWQISADRALPIHENIDHDLYYIQQQSFLLDLVIIIKTLMVPITGIGAR